MAINRAPAGHSSQRAPDLIGPGTVQLWHKRAQQLVSLLGLQDFRFESGDLLGHPSRLEAGGMASTVRGAWGMEKAGLPAQEVERAVFGDGLYMGRLMMPPSPGSRPLPVCPAAVTLAGQVGRAMAARAPAASGR